MISDISSKSNPKIKHFRSLGSDPRYRRTHREFLCEGEKLLYEALAENAQVSAVLCSESAPRGLISEAGAKNIPVYEVPAGLIKFCSTVVTPQNVVFSVKFPPEPDLKPGGRYLVLDAVRDPGNIGTILRAADAFGTDAVIITDDCVDIYSPKTVRSTMGAIFRQAVRIIPRSCAAEKLSSLRVPVYGASAENGAADIADIDLSRCAVVIGNEANGISDEIRSICSGFLKIPMKGRAESLNASVAAGIIAYLMSRAK